LTTAEGGAVHGSIRLWLRLEGLTALLLATCLSVPVELLRNSVEGRSSRPEECQRQFLHQMTSVNALQPHDDGMSTAIGAETVHQIPAGMSCLEAV